MRGRVGIVSSRFGAAATTVLVAMTVGMAPAGAATTTDGTANPVVWYLNSGKLTAVDGDTGMNLYTSTNTCAGSRKWSSPIATKGRIIAGADGKLCSWSVK